MTIVLLQHSYIEEVEHGAQKVDYFLGRNVFYSVVKVKRMSEA